jgi:hypothetical protein
MLSLWTIADVRLVHVDIVDGELWLPQLVYFPTQPRWDLQNYVFPAKK